MSGQRLTREDVERIIAEARRDGRRPDLRGADLREADLRGADLRWADLSGADLCGADLRGANLRWANLRWANLREADLRWANLREANLREADLSGADLCGANLREANLRGANLRGADLREADLSGANLRWAIGLSGVVFLSLSGLPSGLANLWPTPDGWRVSVGCWAGTVDDLATLIEGEERWPEANTPEERALRRPGLRAWIAVCEDHIARHPDVVPELVKCWKVSA